MGCDIHLYVEVQATQDSPWRLTPEQIGTCDTCAGSALNPDTVYCVHCTGKPDEHTDGGKCLFGPLQLKVEADPCRYCHEGEAPISYYYNGRNYDLFGVLADVRGPADPEWTEAKDSWPEDIDPRLVPLLPENCADLHSHNWYTLEQLQAQQHWPDGSLFETVVKRLEKLKHDTNSYDLRVVFCFDN